jgi:hypothetical protein
MAENGKLSWVLIEIIWENSRGKHEDIVRATLEILQKLSLILKLECLQLLFKKVNSIPNSEFNEILINFLKGYTKSAMLNFAKVKAEGSGSIITDTMNFFTSKKNELEESA